jgi:hypothetical protein
MGARYGLSITALKVWWNLGQYEMLFLHPHGDAGPIITMLDAGTSVVRYRKLTAIPEFESSLHSYFADHEVTYKFLSHGTLPGVSGLTSTALNNINLGSIPQAESIWDRLPQQQRHVDHLSVPMHARYHHAERDAEVRSEQLYQRQLGLPNAGSQTGFTELFRTTQDALVNEPWSLVLRVGVLLLSLW